MINLGVMFALIAMFAWGFGDFFIQKNTRRLGVWTTLFVVASFGFLVLTPFAVGNIHGLFTTGLWLFLSAGVVYFVASFLDLEALRRGKLDVVEPIWALEIVSSGLLALLVLKEAITSLQLLFIIILVVSLVLLSFKKFRFHNLILENGVFVAFFAALIMGVANFLIGVGSRALDPVTIKWGLDFFLAFLSLFFIISTGERKLFFKHIMNNKKPLLLMSLFDNVAWLAFGFAMVLAPISIAVAISESYIIIAVLLGLFINKEKLRKHQIISLIFAIISAVYLSSTII